MDEIKVAKFGGTSLSDASQMQKVAKIIRREGYPFVVVSAPGKRFPEDKKITDLLIALRNGNGRSLSENLDDIASRFRAIVSELKLPLSIEPYIEELRQAAGKQGSLDFIKSRGEHICARIMAMLLGYEFLDATMFMRFHASDAFNHAATIQTWRNLALSPEKKYVIPGFYGSLSRFGGIKTFSRGGSDVSGAIVASLLHADCYDNWTDIDGVCLADPKVLGKDMRLMPLSRMTFSESLEAAYRGNEVLHQDVIPILRKKQIPVHIRNTNNPDASGTMIVPDDKGPARKAGEVVCITGRENFITVEVKKDLMSTYPGYEVKVLRVFAKHGINVSHTPGGNESISVVVHDEKLNGKLELVKADLERRCKPDSIVLRPKIATICVVGKGVQYSRVFAALERANIAVRPVDKGYSDLSMIIGVDNDNYAGAIRALYAEFAP